MNQYASMGIVEFEDAINNGSMTAADVLPILDARIAKRAAAGKKQITKVVEYRNRLADGIANSLGITATKVPVPVYTRTATQATLPSDMDSLVAHIKAVVSPADLPAFIARIATN